MKKIWILVAVVAISLVALGAAGLAYAQTQTPPENTANPPVPLYGPGMMGRGARMGGGMGPGMMMGGWGQTGEYGPMHEYMLAAFAETLGISAEELQAELDAGETMWTIVAAQGISEEDFAQLMLDTHAQAIELALADGAITQEQADLMLEHSRYMAENGMGFGNGHCMGRPRGGRGMMGRWNAQP